MAAAAAGGDQGRDQGGWQGGWQGRGRDRDDEWRREKRNRASGDEDEEWDDFPDIDLRRPVPNDSI
jgi:hypothetical protein